MVKNVTILILILICGSTFAQENQYVVYFTDKQNSPYSTDQPEEYLSERAILRRQKQKIQITSDDLPVNPWYLDSLTEKGAEVYYTSRWFNAALIHATAAEAEAIESVLVVDSVAFAAPETSINNRMGVSMKITGQSSEALFHFHNIDSLHETGFTGEGIWVAIMDGGFRGVNTQEAFQHLYEKNKVALVKNFVNNDENVYQYSEHGTKALSIISAVLPDQYTGVSYDATVGLFITEQVGPEYRIEEYNWLFAAEMADSAGFDIINTSLGYSDFDDPEMDYTYQDMDGRSTVITKASNFASERGMLVVTSAGNEGRTSWKYISAPADAFNNIAVGAVDIEGDRASFSSIGPTADGRIKPDISALGAAISVIGSEGTVEMGNGTSFSAPVVTAIAANVWQRFPEFTMNELRQQLLNWGTQADNPDVFTGHGILIYEFINKLTAIDGMEIPGIEIYPNPAQDFIFYENIPQGAILKLLDISGKPLDSDIRKNMIDLHDKPSGIYILQVRYKDHLFHYRLIKE